MEASHHPIEDGITHLNVYSKGKTALGRFLSNFTLFPQDLPEGRFNSIEGYWYYLQAPDSPQREKLQTLHGFEAKKWGRSLISLVKDLQTHHNVNFQTKILMAIKDKILSGPLLDEFKMSSLPFAHYYVMSGKVITTTNSNFILDFLTKLRKELQSA